MDDVTCVSDDSDSGAVLADAVVEVVMGGVGGGVDATESQSIVVCTCVVHVAGACVTIGAMSSSPSLGSRHSARAEEVLEAVSHLRGKRVSSKMTCCNMKTHCSVGSF